MNNWKNITVIALALGVCTTSLYAQPKEKGDKKEEKKEIIIRKKGDVKEKMTIVVDGDKVTVNGKPVDELKDENITIITRDGESRVFAPGVRAMAMPRAEGFGGAQSWSSKSNKALLGVSTEKAEGGVKVTEVSKESGAEKAGLKEDDVITKVDDKKIESPADLVSAIAAHKPGEQVAITYKRGNKESKTNATLTENKMRSFAFNFDHDNYNFNMPDIPEIRQGFKMGENFSMTRRPKIGMQIQDLEEGTGVTVKDVDDDSPASKSGLKEGDIITQVNGKAINGVVELRDAIKDVKEGESFTVTYKRGSQSQTATVKIPKRLRTADL